MWLSVNEQWLILSLVLNAGGYLYFMAKDALLVAIFVYVFIIREIIIFPCHLIARIKGGKLKFDQFCVKLND